MVIISHKHKFVYIRTQKTGSSSLGCNFGELANENEDTVVPMRPLPQLEGRHSSSFMPKGYKQLEVWVARFGTSRAVNHMGAVDASAMLGNKKWEEYTKVSSVRDPFETLVSEYFYLQDYLLHPISYYIFCIFFTYFVLKYCSWVLLSPFLMKFFAWLYGWLRFVDDKLYTIYWYTYLLLTDRFGAPPKGEAPIFKRCWVARESDSRSMAQQRFSDWVDFIFQKHQDKDSEFYHPNQHRMILDANGQIIPLDFYIRFECMQEDFDRVCSHLDGVPHRPVAWLKNGQQTRGRKRVHYSYYYCFSSRELVERENAALIEKFNYQFVEKFNL